MSKHVTTPPAAPRARRKVSLVVSNRPVDRVVLRGTLKRLGYAVELCDEADALSASERLKPHLVVIDAGPDTILPESLLTALDGPARPIVLLVGGDVKDVEALPGDPRIDAAICRPISLDKFVTALARAGSPARG